MPSNNRFAPAPDMIRQQIVALDKPLILDLYDSAVEADKNYDTSVQSTLKTYNRAMVALLRELLPYSNNVECYVPCSQVIILFKLLIKFNTFVYSNNNFKTTSITKAQELLNDDRANDECKDVVRRYLEIHTERNPLEPQIIHDEEFQLRQHIELPMP